MLGISIEISRSDDSSSGSESPSESDESTPNGSSKFLLAPVVSSILDSNGATAVSLLVIAGSIGLVDMFGAYMPLLVLTALVVYTLGLSQFEFGDTIDLETDGYRHNWALWTGIVAMAITGSIYYLGVSASPTVQSVSTGILVFVGWYMNRQLYFAMKEDTRDLNLNPSKSWLYATRLPFVGALVATVTGTVPLIAWVVLTGSFAASSFTYGVIQNIKAGQSNLEESQESQEGDSTPAVNHEEAITPELDDKSEAPASDSDVPEVLKANYDTAKDSTLAMKEAIERVNQMLDERSLPRYKLDTIGADKIPPSSDIVIAIHEDAQDLSSFLEEYHEGDIELRREVQTVQQHIQEIDEFIYKEVVSSSSNQ